MVIGAFPRLLDLLPHPGALIAQVPWASPPQLPKPPELQHWLFERPLVAAPVMLAFALIAVVGGRFQGRPRAGLVVGASFAALAALIAALSAIVVTDRERVLSASRDVMEAIRAGDVARAEPFFAESVAFIASGGSFSVEKDWILSTVRLFPDQLQIEAAKIQQRRAAVDGVGLARSQVMVRGGPRGAAGNLSWWLFSWRRAPDGQWRIHSMDLLLLNGKPPESGMADLIRQAAP